MNTKLHIQNKTIFVTFGDGDNGILEAARRLSLQALGTGCFDTIINADLKLLEEIAGVDYKKNIKFIEDNKRGLGYWIWKPILLKSVFKQFDEGSTILYADAGCEFSPIDNKNLRYYIRLTQKFGSIFFKLPYHEGEWSKSDLLAHKKIGIQRPEKLNQVHATYFFLKNTEINRRFLDSWCEISEENNYHYLDDSPSVKDNHCQFKEHRHDQSIMSCLVHKYRLHTGGYGYYFRATNINKNRCTRFFMHSLRNKSGISYFEGPNMKEEKCNICTVLKCWARIIFLRFKVVLATHPLLRKFVRIC